MCSPMPDIDPDEVTADHPLPCSRYPQCRQECTWPACTEKEESVDHTTYPSIGRINDEGLWVVTAAQADALPEGSMLYLVGDERGRVRSDTATEPHDARPFQGRMRLNGQWIGPTDGLRSDEIYQVRVPLSPSHIPGEVSMGKTEVEASLARSRATPVDPARRAATAGRSRHAIP